MGSGQWAGAGDGSGDRGQGQAAAAPGCGEAYNRLSSRAGSYIVLYLFLLLNLNRTLKGITTRPGLPRLALALSVRLRLKTNTTR